MLKVNVPRNDLDVEIAGYPVPTLFGFGGWFTMIEGNSGEDVVMGDLVLRQGEVNPVMSALLDQGFEVTALHNRFLWDEPRVFFMHIHGYGNAVDLANRLKPALDLIGLAKDGEESAAPKTSSKPTRTLDTEKNCKDSGPCG